MTTPTPLTQHTLFTATQTRSRIGRNKLNLSQQNRDQNSELPEERVADPSPVDYTSLSTNLEESLTDDVFSTWDEDIAQDTIYQTVKKALAEGQRKFPPSLARLRLSIAECNLDRSGNDLFRNRRWIPDSNGNLRTRLIQKIHDSHVHVHPGREALYAIVAREVLQIVTRVMQTRHENKGKRAFLNCFVSQNVFGQIYQWTL
jgi:hypothetical protein